MSDPRVVSEHQIVSEWSEARQLLNDARLSDYTLPQAIDILLGYRDNVINRGGEAVVDLAAARSKRNHPSRRHRADMTGDHNTLADAITALVRQRDDLHRKLADEVDAIGDLWNAVRGDARAIDARSCVATLVEQRDEAVRARDDARFMRDRAFRERERLRKAWQDSQDEVFRARSAVGSRQAATLTADEALVLAEEYGRAEESWTALIGYIAGPRAGIGGAE